MYKIKTTTITALLLCLFCVSECFTAELFKGNETVNSLLVYLTLKQHKMPIGLWNSLSKDIDIILNGEEAQLQSIKNSIAKIKTNRIECDAVHSTEMVFSIDLYIFASTEPTISIAEKNRGWAKSWLYRFDILLEKENGQEKIRSIYAESFRMNDLNLERRREHANSDIFMSNPKAGERRWRHAVENNDRDFYFEIARIDLATNEKLIDYLFTDTVSVDLDNQQIVRSLDSRIELNLILSSEWEEYFDSEIDVDLVLKFIETENDNWKINDIEFVDEEIRQNFFRYLVEKKPKKSDRRPTTHVMMDNEYLISGGVESLLTRISKKGDLDTFRNIITDRYYNDNKGSYRIFQNLIFERSIQKISFEKSTYYKVHRIPVVSAGKSEEGFSTYRNIEFQPGYKNEMRTWKLVSDSTIQSVELDSQALKNYWNKEKLEYAIAYHNAQSEIREKKEKEELETWGIATNALLEEIRTLKKNANSDSLDEVFSSIKEKKSTLVEYTNFYADLKQLLIEPELLIKDKSKWWYSFGGGLASIADSNLEMNRKGGIIPISFGLEKTFIKGGLLFNLNYYSTQSKLDSMIIRDSNGNINDFTSVILTAGYQRFLRKKENGHYNLNLSIEIGPQLFLSRELTGDKRLSLAGKIYLQNEINLSDDVKLSLPIGITHILFREERGISFMMVDISLRLHFRY